MSSLKLIILDYSGTLSRGTVLFGADENLRRRLTESGLAALGVSEPEIFWNELLYPTWEEGATTAQGYKNVLRGRLEKVLSARGRPAPEEAREKALSAFSRAYFENSFIEPVWKDSLTRLARDEGSLTLLATDNYADATERIQELLARWEIPSRPLETRAAEESPKKTRPGFFIANSAFTGFLKADERFWLAARSGLEQHFPGSTFSSVKIIDDFGRNENSGDAYAAPEKVTERREKTTAILEKIFGVPPRVFPFFAGEKDFTALAREAHTFVFDGH